MEFPMRTPLNTKLFSMVYINIFIMHTVVITAFNNLLSTTITTFLDNRFESLNQSDVMLYHSRYFQPFFSGFMHIFKWLA